jgi:hypothetical protein
MLCHTGKTIEEENKNKNSNAKKEESALREKSAILGQQVYAELADPEFGHWIQ